MATIGWTQEELAEKIDVPERRVRLWSLGLATIPEPIANWLERVANLAWKRV
jgi:ribosome-binding protein aMBF1 (putative translation factor)